MKIILQPNAKKNLKKLPQQIIEQIVKKLHSIRSDPLSSLERLVDKPLWKLRIGDYRCICYVNSGKEEIHVLKIGHRKNIYKHL